MCQHVLHKDVSVVHDWTPPEPHLTLAQSNMKCAHMITYKKTEAWSYGPGWCACTDVDHHLPRGEFSAPRSIDRHLPSGSGMDTSKSALSNIQIPCAECRAEPWVKGFKGIPLDIEGVTEVPAADLLAGMAQ